MKINCVSGENFTNDHLFVKYNASGEIVACSDGNSAMGIMGDSVPLKGENATVTVDGFGSIRVSEAVIRGDFLTTAASGLARKVTADDLYKGAQALSAGAAGELVDCRFVGVTLRADDGIGANATLSNLGTTIVNDNLNFALLRAQSTYQGWLQQNVNASITFTFTPSVGAPFVFPFTLGIADSYPALVSRLVTEFNALPAAVSAQFYAYASGALGEWNPSDPVTYNNHFYFKGPRPVSFTVANNNNALIDVFAGNDQAASSTVPGNLTNVESITGDVIFADNISFQGDVTATDSAAVIQAGDDTVTLHDAYYGLNSPIVAAATLAAASGAGPVFVLSTSTSEGYIQLSGDDIAVGTSTRDGRTAGDVQLWSNDLNCATAKFDGTFEVTLGASGSFTTVDAKTVTVVKGIITSIV